MKVNSTKLNLLSSFRQLTREKWALGATILAGKMIGLGLVVLVMMSVPGLFGTSAHAAAAAAAKPTDIETNMMNSINTVWTLVAAFLVFGMQAGFVMLEAGFARKRDGEAGAQKPSQADKFFKRQVAQVEEGIVRRPEK